MISVGILLRYEVELVFISLLQYSISGAFAQAGGKYLKISLDSVCGKIPFSSLTSRVRCTFKYSYFSECWLPQLIAIFELDCTR